MTVRNEIKAQIVRTGYTMQEVVDRLHEEYDWSDSVSNLPPAALPQRWTGVLPAHFLFAKEKQKKETR